MSGGWNTIESDAGVFTYLIEQLGVRNVQFEELISLDPESLQALNPLGVIFLFKYMGGQQKQLQDGEYEYELTGQEPVWFAAQTIQNACGTQAVLSILMNQEEDVEIGKNLQEFKDFTSAFPSEIRGEALSNSDLIRETHNSFARSSPFVSDETKLATADDDVYHFIAYTSINDTLYELDGLQPAPIRHGDVGACPRAILADAVVPVLQRRIARYPATEIRFNLLAMCEDLRARAKEAGDYEGLAQEQSKRAAWRWENALRRHNFVGFVGEIMKGVTKAKLSEKSHDKWIEDAKSTTQKRIDERAKKGNLQDETDV